MSAVITVTTVASRKNIGLVDRIIRTILGIGLVQAAYFWLAGTGQMVAYAAGAIMLATALLRTCPMYAVFGVSTIQGKASNYRRTITTVGAVILLTIAIGGSFASDLLTRRIFLEDFHAMNDAYKQTLFLTGRGERQKAVVQYDRLLTDYQIFTSRYLAYQPHVLKHDRQFSSDLRRVAGLFANVNDKVRTGSLNQAHLELEAVRTVWQNMFKRNGFSMLSVTLVDFHDAMELMLSAASAKDADRLIRLYPEVDEKMKAVEAESSDAEIQTIRKNLDDLLKLAKDARLIDLPAKGEALKSSFVKVYLVRG